MKDEIKIFIKSKFEKIISLKIDQTETVYSLKQKIAEKERINNENIHLFFKRKELDNYQYICNYNIVNLSIIHML